MTNRFENTRLWQLTLAIQLDPDPSADLRRELRSAYDGFRARAEQLAAEIGRDLPDFTVHDITHIDALWEMAQLIAGPDFTLTPPEAFVLGGAFLVHDLGMSIAALPDGVAALRQEPIYRDSIAAELRKRLGRSASVAEQASPGEEVERLATGITLRALHARHAERLALATWKDDRGNQYHLIENPELRRTYGRLIGVVAHSHWWSIDQLASDLPATIGAPGGYPNEWIVDPLKLACLLRAADVSHLDSRRAPSFVRAIRRPARDAIPHWDFQEKLYQPRPEGGRLVFTAKEPFPIDSSQAWWTCFDALQTVDRELRDVDLLLADCHKQRFAVTGVAYADEPRRLARLIPTDGWQPVDTRVRVTAVASLVGLLGGEALYGKNVFAPVRELVQNAADAVRARRMLDPTDEGPGKVVIKVIRSSGEIWLEIEDTGVGMSPAVLSGPLLDFGVSFWGSPLMHQELPGLESSGFTATGKFGIGFFSVFMLGDEVVVFSRRFEASRDDTWVLAFERGLATRPLLRRAKAHELMREGGTRVRVRLADANALQSVRTRRSRGREKSLTDTLLALCPTLDVDLFLQDDSATTQQLIRASDWETLPARDLLARVAGGSTDLDDNAELAAELLAPVRDDKGSLVGRLCIMPERHSRLTERRDLGAVTVGGFASARLSSLGGVVQGVLTRASREGATPSIDETQLSTFASEQARAIASLKSEHLSTEYLRDAASIIRGLGGDPGTLPIALSADGPVTYRDIVDRFRSSGHDEVVLIQDDAVDIVKRANGEFEMLPNVLAADVGQRMFLQMDYVYGRFLSWPPAADGPLGFHSRTAAGLCIEALAEAWEASVEEVIAASSQSTDEVSVSATIGHRDSTAVTHGHLSVIRRPK